MDPEERFVFHIEAFPQGTHFGKIYSLFEVQSDSSPSKKKGAFFSFIKKYYLNRKNCRYCFPMHSVLNF